MRFRAALLSMALGLTIAGIVCADDDTTGNWLTRMVTPAAKTPPAPAQTETKKTDSPPILSSRARRREAEKSYNRRLEAIQKLYTFAEQLDDEKLHKDAELLDQRNFDVYKAACGPVRVSDPVAFKARDTSSKETR